ncbi:ATP-binding cassette domain-containing protein [Nocardioides sp. zg-579]|uniref:ATP-binding cassette domain-containing protein n=1 Tax=Nocardioides marmotae TaxID=2663857 RepID=A0A6I3JA39_9ACTN|nr:ABC transporter ATP-binding protein [Nocardioides marmotae]MCR6031210.1 ATP-binding cassette domain-containing protein [Gordonia jinghuaiqii]MTB94848.1 ATP-binding cassette domain-containing protein [Nocardioides marmotae]QKE01168.1 ABC transporter ATP-binding protein [Nocardioides marmotae]
MTTPLLEVEDLRTVFHTARGDVRAVDGVSFTLDAGETLGLVGESGSGKSVLGRTVMGLVSNGPTTTVTGTVRIGGRDVHALRPAQRRRLWGPEIAMVFQDPMTSLNPVKRIGTHLTETLRLHRRCSRAEATGRAVDLLRQVGIPEPARRLRQYPHELSGGMRQRVVIAMALACDPRLLVADEPTTALDVTVQKQILDLLAALVADRGMAMVLVSHDLGAVAGRTERVQVMYAGRTVESGATGSVFTEPRHPYSDALLGSIPQMKDPPHTRLRTIEGHPPDMTRPPPGCRFGPRCPRADDRCREVLPGLAALPGAAGVPDPPRQVACHHPIELEGLMSRGR